MLRKQCPFYQVVPKNRLENTRFRRRVLRTAQRDHAFRQTLWDMCARDPLFFVNTFLFIFEPRTSATLPFNTFECQDDAILKINAAIGRCDVGIAKSRDMGGSWLVLSVYFWRWLFKPMQSFLVSSRVEDMVDSTEDPDALFPKLDFLLRHLPHWMQPTLSVRQRSHMHMKNPWNGSVIDGAPSTGDMGRGGRRMSVFKDESAMWSLDNAIRAEFSTQPTTKSRIDLSTPQGALGPFFEKMTGDTDCMRIYLHWSQHPFKRRGLYYAEQGELIIVDQEYEFPADYPFILDGELRSPWFDAEERRCLSKTVMAQEHNIDFIGSGALAFNIEVIENCLKRDARSPVTRGDVVGDVENSEQVRFHEHSGGRLLLWRHLTALKRPPAADYVIGCDVAMGNEAVEGGKYASNSTAQIYDRATGVKVGRLKVNSVDPKEFGKLVVALCWWFADENGDGAHLIWESNGPGRLFGDEVTRLGYLNVYYRRDEDALSKRVTGELKPGFNMSKESKIRVLGEYARALTSGECTNRDEESLSECRQYMIMPDGSWKHVRALAKDDPTSSGHNHGDLVVGDAVAWHAIERVTVDDPVAEKEPHPTMSFYGRRKEYERRQAREAQPW